MYKSLCRRTKEKGHKVQCYPMGGHCVVKKGWRKSNRASLYRICQCLHSSSFRSVLLFQLPP